MTVTESQLEPVGSPSAAGVTPTLSGVDAVRLAAAYAECRRITREAARNFYHGLRLTPEPRRSAVYSIYAWMRAADDQVDAPGTPDERRQRLTALAQQTDRVLAGDPSVREMGPFWIAFAATMACYPIDPAHIRDMLAGLAEDLDHQGYQRVQDLERYCYRVASTVGLTCVSIWGLRPGVDVLAAREMAIRRGHAFQLTNILRDIGQDFDDQPSRVYVPRELLAKHGVSAQQLRGWAEPALCEALVRELVDRAADHYQASSGLERLIDPDCAPALWGMSQIYRGLLEVIRSDPSRVVGAARVRLSSARKGLIALEAIGRHMTGSWSGGGRGGGGGGRA